MPGTGTKPLDVGVFPYCELDGIRTFKDSEIMAFYDRMVKDGVANMMFPGGDVRSANEFLREMKLERSILHVAFYGDDPVGLIWLNRFEAKTCRVHFAAFSEFWGIGKALVDIGKDSIGQLLHMKAGTPKEYVFDTLFGLIPSRNIIAIRWVNKVGFHIAAEIPNAVWDAKEARSIPGTLLYLTR